MLLLVSGKRQSRLGVMGGERNKRGRSAISGAVRNGRAVCAAGSAVPAKAACRATASARSASQEGAHEERGLREGAQRETAC